MSTQELQAIPDTRVVHVLDNVPGAVYIGRSMPRYGLKASVWANPYKVGRDGTRAQVIARYRDERLPTHLELLAHLERLRGRPLACWCVPRGTWLPGNWHGETCHGEILAALVESMESVETGVALGALRAGLLAGLLSDLLSGLVADGIALCNLGYLGNAHERSVTDASQDSAD